MMDVVETDTYNNNNATMTPLSAIVEAFEELAKISKAKKNGSEEIKLDIFCDTCSLVSILFGCLGLAFKFAELKYVSKVRFFTLFQWGSSQLCQNLTF